MHRNSIKDYLKEIEITLDCLKDVMDYEEIREADALLEHALSLIDLMYETNWEFRANFRLGNDND